MMALLQSAATDVWEQFLCRNAQHTELPQCRSSERPLLDKKRRGSPLLVQLLKNLVQFFPDLTNTYLAYQIHQQNAGYSNRNESRN